MTALPIDPELVAPLAAWTEATNGGIDLHDIPRTRATMDALADAMMTKVAPREDVRSSDYWIAGPAGAAQVFVRVYQPIERAAALPALLWLHGGGYVLGSVARDDLMARRLCAEGQCVVVSVDYRLAPEHASPAAVEDAHAALEWTASQSESLGIDTQRIAIGGASAGGGVAAGLALLARDRGVVDVCFQLLIYPMLDCHNLALPDADHADTLVWTRENNLMGWQAYLGTETPAAIDASPYASPSRATDLSGLPPAYIPVGDLDLFLDENITYAQRLMRAGVAAELRIYPGGFHGFNGFAPSADVSKRFNAERDAALKRALHPAAG